MGGVRTRRYHALLLVATTPPTGRYVLVNGCDAWIEHDGRRFPLSTQCYTPGITSPDGERRLADFSPTPWPGWSFRLEDGIEVELIEKLNRSLFVSGDIYQNVGYQRGKPFAIVTQGRV